MTRKGPVGLAKIVGWTEVVTRTIAASGIFLMMITIVIDVAARKIQNVTIPGAFELVELTVVIVAFLGMTTAAVDGQHVRSTLLVGLLPRKEARITQSAGSLIAIAILAAVIYGTAIRAIESIMSHEVRIGLTAFPAWPARVAIPIGLLGFLLVLVMELRGYLRNQSPASELVIPLAP